MKVRLPSPLDSYTGGLRTIDLKGESLGAVLDALDGRFPGVKFRIVDERGCLRRHINLFVNEDLVTDLARRLAPSDEVMIVAALSGG